MEEWGGTGSGGCYETFVLRFASKLCEEIYLWRGLPMTVLWKFNSRVWDATVHINKTFIILMLVRETAVQKLVLRIVYLSSSHSLNISGTVLGEVFCWLGSSYSWRGWNGSGWRALGVCGSPELFPPEDAAAADTVADMRSGDVGTRSLQIPDRDSTPQRSIEEVRFI